MLRSFEGEAVAGLEEPVTIGPETEHRSAEHDGIEKGCTRDVLNHVRLSNLDQRLSEWSNQIGMVVLPDLLSIRVELTRRGARDHIELMAMLQNEFNGITAVKIKWVPRLGRYVNPDNIEAGVVITLAGSALAAEEIEKLGLQ
jgi:hypothetical protein